MLHLAGAAPPRRSNSEDQGHVRKRAGGSRRRGRRVSAGARFTEHVEQLDPSGDGAHKPGRPRFPVSAGRLAGQRAARRSQTRLRRRLLQRREHGVIDWRASAPSWSPRSRRSRAGMHCARRRARVRENQRMPVGMARDARHRGSRWRCPPRGGNGDVTIWARRDACPAQPRSTRLPDVTIPSTEPRPASSSSIRAPREPRSPSIRSSGGGHAQLAAMARLTSALSAPRLRCFCRHLGLRSEAREALIRDGWRSRSSSCRRSTCRAARCTWRRSGSADRSACPVERADALYWSAQPEDDVVGACPLLGAVLGDHQLHARKLRRQRAERRLPDAGRTVGPAR